MRTKAKRLPVILFAGNRNNTGGFISLTPHLSGTFSGSSGGICLFQSDDGLHWRSAAHPKVLESSYLLEDGTRSIARLERPALLIENDEPTYLFGAADGYQKGGKVSGNVQIPLVP